MTEVEKGHISDGYHTFDELYEHRHWLFLSMVFTHRNVAWASKKHADGSCFDGWFICGLDLPVVGQISYHLPDSLWGVVEQWAINREIAPEWDGHTAQDVVKRLSRFLTLSSDVMKV